MIYGITKPTKTVDMTKPERWQNTAKRNAKAYLL